MDTGFPAWRIALAALGFVWLVEVWLRHRRRRQEHSPLFDPTLERLWRAFGWTLATTGVGVAVLVSTHLPRLLTGLVGVVVGAGGLLLIALATWIGLRAGRTGA